MPNPGINVLVVEPVPQNMEKIKQRSELNEWSLESKKFKNKNSCFAYKWTLDIVILKVKILKARK